MNNKHGVGRQLCFDNDNLIELYEGEFNNGDKEGYGREIREDYYYQGQFKDGDFHGYGQLHYDDGTIEKGQFKDGFFNE